MEHIRFAVCITFPGTTSFDVVNAAILHSVHILDKELYEPAKDYRAMVRQDADTGIRISPLFLFPEGSVFAEDESSWHLAMEQMKEYQP